MASVNQKGNHFTSCNLFVCTAACQSPHSAFTFKRSIKVVKPKIDLRSSSFKAKSLVPMTPVMVKSKSSAGELSAFDFNTVVPTLACTPVQRVKPIASAHKAPKTASKLHFQIYEESPDQDKARPVPAAPRCTRRRQFRVSI